MPALGPYLHLDVFTDRVFGGNQLAVFPLVDSGRERRGREPRLPTPTLPTPGLPKRLQILPTVGIPSPDLMQALTREMAYSECTFVFPPEQPDTEVRVRIFTPGRELPMAGHPTIGTAFALAHEGIIPPGQPSVVFGLGVGPVSVSLRWTDRGLAFAEMTQLRPTFGPPVAALDAVAEALGVAEAEIRSTGVPVQEISCGIPFLTVPLATRAAVDAAALDRAGLTRLCSGLGSRPTVEGLPLLHRTFRRRRHRLQPHVCARPGRPRGPRHRRGQRSARLLSRAASSRRSRRRRAHRQPAGCEDGTPEPHSHCHRGHARGDYAGACRRIGCDGGRRSVTCGPGPRTT